MKTETSEIKNLVEAYDRALNEGDAQAIADLFAENALMLPPNEAVIAGKEAICLRHKNLFDQVKLQHALNSDNLIISDTLAVVEGIYEMTVISRQFAEKSTERGKYVTIFQKQPGGYWKIRFDIWNSFE